MIMSPHMFKEYLDFREVVSLSLEGRVITGKDYYSNNEIKELERRLINAVKNKEINAKTYITHNFFYLLGLTTSQRAAE